MGCRWVPRTAQCWGPWKDTLVLSASALETLSEEVVIF